MYAFFRYEPIKKIISIIESSKKTLIISICGGSCAGKTTLAQHLEFLGLGSVLAMDNFYKPISEIEEYKKGIPAFDTPGAFEIDRLIYSLTELRNGNIVQIPSYLYSKIENGRDNSRVNIVKPSKIILLDGILSYCDEISDHVDFALFVNRDPIKRRKSRIVRDVKERGVSSERAAEIYDKMVIPLYENIVLPQRLKTHFFVENKP